jgi:hypothetical protein
VSQVTAVLIPTPGIEVRTSARGWASRRVSSSLASASRTAWTSRSWAANSGDDREDAEPVQVRPESAFQRRVDVQQRVAEAVGEPGGLGGEVLVVAGEHGQRGQGLVVGPTPAQGVRHRPYGIARAASAMT